MIQLKGIEKIYQSSGVTSQALSGVSLDIQEGEMVAIMGTSGSGKSTLLNIIGAMDVATAGTYFFKDIEVTKLSMSKLHQFRKDYISFIFQNFELMNRYTVYENVELSLLARGKHGYRKKVMEILDYVGIKDLAHKKVTKLSGGEQQRCAIARALLADTPVILADEPTGALDHKTSESIIELLTSLNKEGKTIVIVTHDNEVANSCGRIIRLEDGQCCNI